MPIAFRADLLPFLSEFVEQHRGVRLGRMFGLPAGFAGRRMFVCLIEDGVIVRLPDDVARREIGGTGTPYGRRGRVLGSWVMYRPRTLAIARRLTAVLETAAMHVARSQGQETSK